MGEVAENPGEYLPLGRREMGATGEEHGSIGHIYRKYSPLPGS